MIKVICVGKIKENYLKDAVLEYKKRLFKYTKLEIIEVEDFNDSNIASSLLKERDLILKNITDRDFVILLDINGKGYSSEEISKHLNEWLMYNPNITFIIGGSNGVHQDILKRSNLSWSFSKLTFPHQLFRVMLLEQLYRAFKILNNETYHK